MRSALLIAIAVATIGISPAAQARGKAAHERAANESPDDETLKQAQAALVAARAALAKNDAVQSYRRAAEAFRLVPSPEALFLLGQVAQLEHRELDAQDLMRRYLADPNLESAADSPEQQLAQRIVDGRREKSAKLNILGDRGTLIAVDGRLVGVVPLSRPLIVSPAKHKIEIYRGERRLEDEVRVPVGRLGELRADLKTKSLILSVLPGVVVLDRYAGLRDGEARRLEQSLEEAVQAERLSPLSRELALETAGEPEPGPCPDETRCLLGIAEKCESDYLLTVRAEKRAADYAIEMQLFDVAVSEPAARMTTSCPGCSVEQAQKLLADKFAPLYKQATARTRGQLDVRSEPSDAELLLDGQRIGKTPYQAAVWAGTRELLVRKKDHAEERREVRISDGETAKLEVTLSKRHEPEPPPLPLTAPSFVMKRAPRPIWRLTAGAVTLGAGLLMTGFGASALSFNQKCVQRDLPADAICPLVYNTLSPSVGLLTVGPIFVITGVALLAKPGPWKRVQVTAASP